MTSPASIDRIHAALLVGGVATHEAPIGGAFAFKSFLGGEVAVDGVEPCEAQHAGLILPTLQEPAYITTDADGIHFHKALVANNNITGFARVTLTPGNRASVSVSDRPAHLGEIVAGIAAGSDLVADAVGEGEALFKCLWVGVVGGLSGATTATTTAVVDWELASALLGWGGEFFKADQPIPAGARWITVHPNGNGSKGVPVLVQPAQDGTFRVIGGAGGKLNMLKLRGVKSQEEYRQEHAQRAAEKRNQRREQVRRDKELGIHEAKVAARENINEQRKSAQRDFIQQVADAMGWSDAEMALDTKGLSEEAQKKAEQQHHARLLAKAKEAVATQRQMLVASQDARAAAGLGEVPLNAGMDQLSVDDIDPVRVSESAGVSQAFKARSEAAGLTQDKLDSEVGRIREREVERTGRAGRDQDAAVDRGDVAELVRKELEAVPKPELKARVVDAQRAVKLLKAQKAMQALEKAAREANRAVDASTVEPRAYVLEASDTVEDRDVLRGLADDVRTRVASSFLAGVKEAGGEDAVEAHATAGAYNAINALSQTVGGGSMLDRSVVDVLGIAGAAQVLARRLHRDLRDVDEVAAGLEEFHVTESPKRQQEAIDSARELQDAAAEIEQGEAAHASDLAAASELNRQRKEHLAEARKVLGQALGEGEAHAAMIAALRAGPRESLDVSLGKTPLDSAVKQLWALGLKEGDYTIDRVAGNTFATIHAAGMDKLAAPVDKENMERVSRNLAIMRGDHDEDDWMPQGFARRPDLDLKPPPGVAATLAAPMDWGHPDREQALKDHIGGRMADGEAPADILADVQSGTYFERSGDADGYRAALDAVVPNKDGKRMVRAEDLAPVFDRYADDYVQRRWGGQRSTLNKQSFEPDAVAQDALHRALSDEPTGVAAYKSIGDMTRGDRKALRAYFAKHIAKESPEQAQLREHAEKLQANEPEHFMEDMFGEVSENPAWRAWRTETDQALASVAAAGLDWNRYCKMVGGKAKAFEAVQDLVRSRVAESFAKSYNTLRPHAPLKVGRTVVRNNIGHLSAIDPEERERRLAMERELIDGLRERVNGRYASGSVSDRIEGQREQQAAFEQSQMGFFAADELEPPGAAADRPLKPDERHTVGHAAEQMISRMMGVVGGNFEPGKPVKLFNPSMSADRSSPEAYKKTKDNAKRQRMIKLIVENKRVIAGAGVGSGKAQPLDAKLLTPSGWVRMGDAYVGMPIVAGDGSVSVVTGVYPQGEKPIYRVTMADGGSTECCDEHLWLTTTELERKRIARGSAVVGAVRPLSEVRASLTVRHGIRNHHAPLAGVAGFRASPVPIDPYVLGALLGDGSISAGGHARLSSADPELVARVGAALPGDCVVIKEVGANFDYRITRGSKGGALNPKNALSVALLGLGVAGCNASTKFIPNLYLFNSVEVRLAVLQGLLDTDGWLESDGGSVKFTSISNELAQGVEFLCRSLGGISRRTLKRPTYTHNGEKKRGQDAHVITLSLPSWVRPFRLRRKDDAFKPKTKYAPRARVIDSVEFVGVKRAQCIAIAHPSHLYVTDDFIVTHNTGMGLGAFAHLHSTGKVKKGLFVVPSIVQGQFGAEALRFLKPGQFSWHCEPGGSYEDRLAAYKNPDSHFAVVTHQSFRDDLLRMASAKEGVEADEINTKLAGMSKEDRAKYVKDVLDHHGIAWDYVMADEAHGLLNRAGKENSGMSNIIEGATDNAEYYMHASGDPVKNDASEAFSLLQKMDGARYNDRDAFMRRYGGDTQAAKEGLQRELARHLYAMSVKPDVKVTRTESTVKQSPEQQAALDTLENSAASLRIARMTGKVDVSAAKAFAPAMFEGVPDERHEEVAKKVAEDVVILKQTAIKRILNNHPSAAKLDHVAAMAKERKGKQGVVFAHNLEAVDRIKARLESEGHRVVTISGKDSSADKAAKIQAFNPDKGDATADIIVCSDAGATGANLQSGKWLCQYDCPDTAMTHAQRQGRINRIGQKNPVELIDLIADHDLDRRARKRLATKYNLRELLTSPLEGIDDSGLAHYLHRRSVGDDSAQGDLF